MQATRRGGFENIAGLAGATGCMEAACATGCKNSLMKGQNTKDFYPCVFGICSFKGYPTRLNQSTTVQNEISILFINPDRQHFIFIECSNQRCK